MTELISFNAYHGTFQNRIEAIVKLGFQPSVNDDDWLGVGSYFFIDGLNDAISSAMDWAVCSSWNKQNKCFIENRLAVVKTELTAPASCIFDLRELENAKTFHLFRREWLQKQQSTISTNLVRPQERTYDGAVLNEFRERHGIGILIANFHIQFTVNERYLRLDSRIPNVSVLCLAPEADSLIQCKISEVRTVDAVDWIQKNNI